MYVVIKNTESYIDGKLDESSAQVLMVTNDEQTARNCMLSNRDRTSSRLQGYTVKWPEQRSADPDWVQLTGESSVNGTNYDIAMTFQIKKSLMVDIHILEQ